MTVKEEIFVLDNIISKIDARLSESINIDEMLMLENRLDTHLRRRKKLLEGEVIT